MCNQYKVTVDGQEMPDLIEADDVNGAFQYAADETLESYLQDLTENYCDGGASQDLEITVSGAEPVIGDDDQETGERKAISLTRTVRLVMRADWEVVSR